MKAFSRRLALINVWMEWSVVWWNERKGTPWGGLVISRGWRMKLVEKSESEWDRLRMEKQGRGGHQWEALVGGEDLNKQRRSVWTGKGGGSSAMAIVWEGAHRGNESSVSYNAVESILKSGLSICNHFHHTGLLDQQCFYFYSQYPLHYEYLHTGLPISWIPEIR